MIKKVDIAHGGQSSEEALILLETAISVAKNDPNVVAVKIVHGLGSGRVAEKVRAWAKEQEGRFRALSLLIYPRLAHGVSGPST